MRLRFKATVDRTTYPPTYKKSHITPVVKAYGDKYIVDVGDAIGNMLLKYWPNNWERVYEPALSAQGYMPYVWQTTEPSMINGDIKLWHNTLTDKWFIIWKQNNKVRGIELGTAPPATYHEKVTQANIDSKIAIHAAKTVQGTVVLPSGDTQVQVAHGYSGTPTFIIAIPNQNIGNVWITNIGDTTFTINTSASTDTDTTFYWLAGG